VNLKRLWSCKRCVHNNSDCFSHLL
jgi:hypothetical protein